MEAQPQFTQEIDLAIQHITMGQVIAYPTESVYGFGCDPYNSDAVASLLALKQRDVGKGLILVAHHFDAVENLVRPIEPILLSRIYNTWPGPVTWVFPASSRAPKWITGNNDSIAIRISNHPIIKTLCKTYKGPIVSTSANTSGQIPATCARTVKMMFGDNAPYIVNGQVGKLQKPTTIRDAMTGEVLRA